MHHTEEVWFVGKGVGCGLLVSFFVSRGALIRGEGGRLRVGFVFATFLVSFWR